jgi:hypothetical protein
VLGRRARIGLMWSEDNWYIMCIEIIDKNSNRWLLNIVTGVYDSTRERGSTQELFIGINPTHFLEIIVIVYKPSNCC